MTNTGETQHVSKIGLQILIHSTTCPNLLNAEQMQCVASLFTRLPDTDMYILNKEIMSHNSSYHINKFLTFSCLQKYTNPFTTGPWCQKVLKMRNYGTDHLYRVEESRGCYQQPLPYSFMGAVSAWNHIYSSKRINTSNCMCLVN